MTAFYYDEKEQRWKCTYAPLFPVPLPSAHAIIKPSDLPETLKELQRTTQAKIVGDDVRRN